MSSAQSIGAANNANETASESEPSLHEDAADTNLPMFSTASIDTSHGLVGATFDPDIQWPEILDFLNQREAFLDEDDDLALMALHQSRNSLLHHEDTPKKHATCRWCWRRLQAVCKKPPTFEYVDPSEPLVGLRNAIGRIIMSAAAQSSVMFFILVDISIFIYKILKHPDNTFGFGSLNDADLYTRSQITAFLFVDWLVFGVLGAEVLGRIAYKGKKFTHSILNLLEVSLVPIMAFELLTRDEGTDLGIPTPMFRACRPLIRSTNLVAKAIRGFNHALHLRRALQLQVAGTNKRFQQDGFNLDLCYITSQIIAMGRPAVGQDALFNNSLGEIARFFDSRHRNRYIIINAAEEGFDYPKWPFHQRVVRFPIAEHGVPKLADLWKLCQAIQLFLDFDERNVCAVHAHSSGGQVGMVIGACLLYSGAFRQATAAMNNYERTRTAAGAAESVQGFDSASQQRFIEYFSTCVHEIHAIPTPPIQAHLETIRVIGLDVEEQDGVSVRVFVGRGKNKTAALSRNFVEYSSTEESREETLALLEEEEDEAVMLMMHEDDVLKRAEDEKRKVDSRALGAGCTPLKGLPFVDTADDAECACKRKIVRLQGDDVGWKFEHTILAGELCVEVHVRRRDSNENFRSTSTGNVSGPSRSGVSKKISDGLSAWSRKNQQVSQDTIEKEDNAQMLFAAWFHTSFLKQSQSMNLNRELGDTAIGIELGRFGVDKACGARSLQSYGASFQLQLKFHVDHDLNHRPHDTVYRSRLEDEEEGQRVLKELHPPGDTDVSDFYSIGWLSWCVQRLWPCTETALVRLMRESVEPLLQDAVPGPLKSIHFSAFQLGTGTPELGPLVASQRRGDTAGLQLDMIVKYRGDVNILMDAKLAKIGVSYVELLGTLSILFDPIVDSTPIVGGMKLFFFNPPVLHMKFVGLAELAQIPFLQKIVEGTIQEALADILVLPNVLCINWMPSHVETGEPSAHLTNKLPTGILRVVVLHVEGIRSQHKYYVILKFGATTTKTALSKRSANPVWNETHDLLLYDLKQTLFIELWRHESRLKGDKMMGKTLGLEIGSLLRSERGVSRIVLDSHSAHTRPHHLSKLGSSLVLKAKAEPKHSSSSLVDLNTELFTLIAERTNLETRISESLADQVSNIALLVCDVKKGRIPESRLSNSSVCIRIGRSEVERKCKQIDETWKTYADLSDVTINTIEVLVREGFGAAKIAEILKQPEPLVSKAMAHCLGFNIELPHHFCVLVPANCFSAESVEIEVRRKGRVEAKCSISLKEVMKDANMKYHRLIKLSAGPRQRTYDKAANTPESRQNRFDLDICLQLFALSPSQMNASRALQKLKTTATESLLKGLTASEQSTQVCGQADEDVGQKESAPRSKDKVIMDL